MYMYILPYFLLWSRNLGTMTSPKTGEVNRHGTLFTGFNIVANLQNL